MVSVTKSVIRRVATSIPMNVQQFQPQNQQRLLLLPFQQRQPLVALGLRRFPIRLHQLRHLLCQLRRRPGFQLRHRLLIQLLCLLCMQILCFLFLHINQAFPLRLSLGLLRLRFSLPSSLPHSLPHSRFFHQLDRPTVIFPIPQQKIHPWQVPDLCFLQA